VGRKRI